MLADKKTFQTRIITPGIELSICSFVGTVTGLVLKKKPRALLHVEVRRKFSIGSSIPSKEGFEGICISLGTEP